MVSLEGFLFLFFFSVFFFLKAQYSDSVEVAHLNPKYTPEPTKLNLKYQKFSGGACPQTPLAGLRACGARQGPFPQLQGAFGPFSPKPGLNSVHVDTVCAILLQRFSK